jgi:hypothetical protein
MAARTVRRAADEALLDSPSLLPDSLEAPE